MNLDIIPLVPTRIVSFYSKNNIAVLILYMVNTLGLLNKLLHVVRFASYSGIVLSSFE